MASNYSSIDTESLDNKNSTALNNEKSIQLKLVSQDGPKVHGHVVCVHNNIMYLHGGLIENNNKLPSNKLYRFDFENGWKDISLYYFYDIR